MLFSARETDPQVACTEEKLLTSAVVIITNHPRQHYHQQWVSFWSDLKDAADPKGACARPACGASEIFQDLHFFSTIHSQSFWKSTSTIFTIINQKCTENSERALAPSLSPLGRALRTCIARSVPACRRRLAHRVGKLSRKNARWYLRLYETLDMWLLFIAF